MSATIFRKKIFFVFSLLQISYFAFAPSVFAAPTDSKDVFPKLPASHVCTAEKIHGVWKLLMVYEVPSGREIELYTSRPLQYLVFEPNSRYGDYVSPLRAISPVDVRSAILEDKVTKQFAVNSKGSVFIYNSGIAIDTLACFITDESSGPFESGQMLIMPPKNVAKGRMVKVYAKVPLDIFTPPKSSEPVDDKSNDTPEDSSEDMPSSSDGSSSAPKVSEAIKQAEAPL